MAYKIKTEKEQKCFNIREISLDNVLFSFKVQNKDDGLRMKMKKKTLVLLHFLNVGW